MVKGQPERLVIHDGGARRMAIGGIAFGVGFIVVVFGIVMATTDAQLSDLTLPAAALGSFWLLWAVVYVVVGAVHRRSDKRSITELFDGEIWASWTVPAEAWREIVDAEFADASPPADKSAFSGAIYSGALGLVFAIVLVLVGFFAIDDDSAMPMIWIVAVCLVIGLAGVGVVQPITARREAERARRRDLVVTAPTIWFGAGGAYHETRGFDSFERLVEVADNTRARRVITLTVMQRHVFGGSGVGSSTSWEPVPLVYDVPELARSEAADLVRRYRADIRERPSSGR